MSKTAKIVIGIIVVSIIAYVGYTIYKSKTAEAPKVTDTAAPSAPTA